MAVAKRSLGSYVPVPPAACCLLLGSLTSLFGCSCLKASPPPYPHPCSTGAAVPPWTASALCGEATSCRQGGRGHPGAARREGRSWEGAKPVPSSGLQVSQRSTVCNSSCLLPPPRILAGGLGFRVLCNVSISILIKGHSLRRACL